MSTESQSTFRCSYNLNGEGLIIDEDADSKYIDAFMEEVENGLITIPGSYSVTVTETDGVFKFEVTSLSLG